MLKVEVYIPEEALTGMLETIKSFKLRTFGNYINCLSYYRVQSAWTPVDEADPYLGTVGEEENAAEYVISFRCPEELLDQVVEAVRRAHPYEEPCIDVFRLYDPTAPLA